MFPNQDEQVLGPGKLLQVAREEKNLRPEDVAYEIRLTPSQVLALEENDYSKMPEETYVRGYLRNYARLVGIPENTILMAFARQTRGNSEKKPQPVIPSSETEINKGGKGIRLLAVFLIVAVIALSAVWVLEPYDKLSLTGEKVESPVVEEKTVVKEVPLGASTISLDKTTESPAVETTAMTAPSAAEPASETSSTPIVISQPVSSEEAPATSASTSVTETLPTQDQSEAEAEAPIPAQSEDATETVEIAETETAPTMTGTAESESTVTVNTETENTTAESPPEPISDGTLIISYSKDSWTDVRDANGKKLLYRTVKKGENIVLAGELPMSVFFGFAQGVKVTFNGNEIDVPGYTRGVFARFTVGEPENP